METTSTKRRIAAAVAAALATIPDEKPDAPPKRGPEIRPGFLRPNDAATYLGISRRHISNLTRRGLLPVARIGSRLSLYAVADLESAVASFRVGKVKP